MARKRKLAPEPAVVVKVTFRMPDGREFEWEKDREDQLPADVREALHGTRAKVWEKLIESFAKQDNRLGEAIRLYRSIPHDMCDDPEIVDFKKKITDGIMKTMSEPSDESRGT